MSKEEILKQLRGADPATFRGVCEIHENTHEHFLRCMSCQANDTLPCLVRPLQEELQREQPYTVALVEWIMEFRPDVEEFLTKARAFAGPESEAA